MTTVMVSAFEKIMSKSSALRNISHMMGSLLVLCPVGVIPAGKEKAGEDDELPFRVSMGGEIAHLMANKSACSGLFAGFLHGPVNNDLAHAIR